MDNNSHYSDALLLVQQRNGFYKKKLRWMLSICCLSLLVVSILGSLLIYLYSFQAKPSYFVADEFGRLMKDIPLSELNMSYDDLLAWTIEAVERANSFDFLNYRAQLQDAQKYFLNQSWDVYMKQLTLSDNLLALTQRNWVFVAKVVGQPKLLTQGTLNGMLAYKFEMPLIVSYLKPPLFDMKTSTANALVVTVIVIRQNLLESYKGLAIFSMVMQNAPERPKKLDMLQG